MVTPCPGCTTGGADAHARSATNPRFLTVYRGTDTQGNQSPPRRYTRDPDYGPVPLPPSEDEPYYGPGYKLDFPDADGNCAACHVPVATARRDSAYEVDPTKLEPIERDGVSCELCHKAGGV